MLGTYIKKAAGRKFEWGVHDCSTFCADWMITNGHSDPMADIRGRYHDESTGIAFIHDNGGLVKLWADRMHEPTPNPSDGAIGVLDIRGEYLMGIFTGERWIMLMECGIKAARLPSAKIIKAWDIG